VPDGLRSRTSRRPGQGFSFSNGRIAGIEMIADPARIDELVLALRD
jgi:hypothetical protein